MEGSLDPQVLVVICLQFLLLLIKVMEHWRKSRCHTCCGLCETETHSPTEYRRLENEYKSLLTTTAPQPLDPLFSNVKSSESIV